MDKYEIKSKVEQHGNFKYIFMNEEELRAELKGWCREDLINWLKWNDPNGVYDDEESLTEIGSILTYEEGVELIVNQIVQNVS